MSPESIKDKLSGAVLELQDEIALQKFYFSTRGNGVSATLGSKEGFISGPALRYKVADDLKVLITDAHSVLFVWEDINFSDGLMTTKCSGKLLRFLYTPAKPSQNFFRRKSNRDD